MKSELKITRGDLENFKPTKEMISHAGLVFLTMAQVETIKPIVLGIQRKVLEKHRFPYKQEKSKRLRENYTGPVLDPEHTYLMRDKDFKVYLREVEKLEDEAGLRKGLKPDYCPLLVAESDLRTAKNLLLDDMTAFTGIDHKEIYKMDLHDKYLDLTLRLLAPYVDSTKLLEEVKACKI